MPGFSKTELDALDAYWKMLDHIETTEGYKMTNIEIELEGVEPPLTVRIPEELIQDGQLTEAFYEARKVLDAAQREVEKERFPSSYGKVNATSHEIKYVIGILDRLSESDTILTRLGEYVFSTLANKIHRNAKDKGWYSTDRQLPEELALVHSEVSEWLEEYRNGFGPKEHYYRKADGTLTKEFRDWGTPEEDASFNKPEGQGAEAADIIIRVLDICGNPDRPINIARSIQEKFEYNRTRKIRHGGKLA